MTAATRRSGLGAGIGRRRSGRDRWRPAQDPRFRRALRASALRRARRAKWAARRWAARRRRSSAGRRPSGSTARSKAAMKAARALAVRARESYRACSTWAPIRPRRTRSMRSADARRRSANPSLLNRRSSAHRAFGSQALPSGASSARRLAVAEVRTGFRRVARDSMLRRRPSRWNPFGVRKCVRNWQKSVELSSRRVEIAPTS